MYDFELVRDGAVVAAKRAVALPNAAAAWPIVARLARTVDAPGARIRVRDEAGGIVILTGVASALRYADAMLAA